MAAMTREDMEKMIRALRVEKETLIPECQQLEEKISAHTRKEQVPSIGE
ncbi:MAG: hypothetical protein IKJ32_01070 [Clostridia bacterium]|nr:hypothetical protein [Clostridia bacterium]